MSKIVFRLIGICAACTAVACSDPLPPAASAGLNFQTTICPSPVVSPKHELGNPAPNNRTDTLGNPVFSGEQGALIRCSVSGTDTFTFSGSVNKGKDLGFSVQGTYSKTTGAGTAKIGLSSPAVPAYVEDPNCSINIVRYNGALLLNSGEIWATFNCSNLFSPPNVQCGALGEFVFQRCSN